MEKEIKKLHETSDYDYTIMYQKSKSTVFSYASFVENFFFIIIFTQIIIIDRYFNTYWYDSWINFIRTIFRNPSSYIYLLASAIFFFIYFLVLFYLFNLAQKIYFDKKPWLKQIYRDNKIRRSKRPRLILSRLYIPYLFIFYYPRNLIELIIYLVIFYIVFIGPFPMQFGYFRSLIEYERFFKEFEIVPFYIYRKIDSEVTTRYLSYSLFVFLYLYTDITPLISFVIMILPNIDSLMLKITYSEYFYKKLGKCYFILLIIFSAIFAPSCYYYCFYLSMVSF
ncbi:MAG: hypothetical protein ACTSRP_20135 [Candidatus Helarchaeota archaeon]